MPRAQNGQQKVQFYYKDEIAEIHCRSGYNLSMQYLDTEEGNLCFYNILIFFEGNNKLNVALLFA